LACLSSRLRSLKPLSLRSISPAPDGRSPDQQEAAFYQNFLAVQKIRRQILQVRIDQRAVNIHERRCRVRHIVQLLPRPIAELRAEVRSHNYKQEGIESKRTQIVVEAL